MITRIMIAVTILALTLNIAHAVESDSLISPEVEKAVLSSDWEMVAELLKNVNPDSPSPVKRLIKGHACLSLNRNNESLSLFASTLDNKSQSQWKEWVDRIANLHEHVAVAWYFKGDAFARRGDWDLAIESFDKALTLDPGDYLALNARGVVSHAVGNTLMARLYFKKAIEAKREFADAYASRGTLNIYQYSARDGIDAYQKASYFSKDAEPILPYIGLGCVQYAQNDFDKALNSFASIPKNTDLDPLIDSNYIATRLAMLDRAVKDAKRVGTNIESILYENENLEGEIVVEDSPTKGVYFASKSGKWRVWIGIPGVIGGEITGTWEDGETGEGEDSGAGGEDKGKENKKSVTSSTAAQIASMTLPISRDLLYDVLFSTTGPGKRGGRGGATNWPDNWHRPTGRGRDRPPAGQQPKLGKGKDKGKKKKSSQAKREIWQNPINILVVLNAEIDKQVKTAVITNPVTLDRVSPVGGADSDPSRSRSNRGRWGVTNVYGLLYSIPEHAHGLE